MSDESRLDRDDEAIRGMTGTPDSGIIEGNRAVLTSERKEDMQHPSRVWADAMYANESLQRLSDVWAQYLKGRGAPATEATTKKYVYTLRTFIQSLERNGEPPILSSLRPYAVNRWIAEQRHAGRSEDGIASRLASLKAFSRKFVFMHLDLTTCDLLGKVPRITPPEKPFPRLTQSEQERIIECFDRATYEDIRNRALIAAYLSTGRRMSEILNLKLTDIDTITGEIRVRAKGGDTQTAVLSSKAMKLVKQYLHERKAHHAGERLWLTEDGAPLSSPGLQSVFRRLKVRSGVNRLHCHLLRHNFAQAALENGAERALVQDMLGHKTEAMTRRYTSAVRQQNAARRMPQYSPF